MVPVERVDSSYNANDVEEWVQGFWRTQEIYEKTKALLKDGEPFFFVDGPPYTTGYIHLGTAWNKIIKDCILRFYRLKGRYVFDRAGYDMHGLPIEVKVEHALGFNTKKDIESYGIGPFIERCREFALKNKDIMSKQFQRLGVWLDFENSYQTLSNDYIAAAWWTLKRAEEKGMLERGHRVVNWCPRCETAIADAEVEYWDVTDPSIFVKFPLEGKENEYLVIWTTTPWTLPANVAIAIHPGFRYVRVRARKDGKEEILWVADDLVKSVLKKGKYGNYDILERKVGSDLIGLKYHSPLEPFVPYQDKKSHRVVAADFVTMENTGMVHIAPGHGWDDYLIGIREHLDLFCPVDTSGKFNSDGGKYEGLHVKDANPTILSDLGDSLIAREQLAHRYGHCWRCKTPIIFRATEQWFLKASDLRDQMLDEIEKVQWFPDWAGSARFHDWVKEARDWCISRQRYWGIPIPVWECVACHTYKVIGSFTELTSLSGKEIRDPHRPYVDELTFPCLCGGEMHRIEDIFDVWFDSAVASWATLGYPITRDAFDRYWPAEFITEGQDQTRGWFYSQLGASTIAFGCSPYRSVLMHGFALDAEGRKMSKSLGNMVSPEEIINQFGADVLRLYVLTANAPWDDLKFNWEGVKTVNRTINILWNVYRFPLPYMILDFFVPSTTADGSWDDRALQGQFLNLSEEDQWILSRINSVTKEVERAMTEYQLHQVTRSLIAFILNDLSRWYIQLVRPRMWLEEDAVVKEQAYQCIYYVLRRLSQLLSPFIPHIAEKMYNNLRLPKDLESVHMEDWKVADESMINAELEAMMDIVRLFDDAVASARQVGKRKLRWPVSECIVATNSPNIKEALVQLNSICKTRANSRIIRIVDAPWSGIIWRPVALMKELGPAFGRDSPKVKELIERSDGTNLKQLIERNGTVTLTTGNQNFMIDSMRVTFFEQVPKGFFSSQMKDATVYVNTSLTPELESEGYTREIIRRLQEMRRQLDLRVEDFIVADVAINDTRVCEMVRGMWADTIAGEVRANDLTLRVSREGDESQGTWDLRNKWHVEGVIMQMNISRLISK